MKLQLKKIKTYICSTMTTIVVLTTSCSQLIQIDLPKDQLPTEEVFADSASSIAAMLGAYAKLSSNSTPFVSVYSTYIGEYTDECYTRVGGDLGYAQSLLTPETGVNSNGWTYLYSVIYQSNLIIEQLTTPKNLSPSLSKLLVAEAKFLRAWAYFYLVNLYENIPLILTTDVNQTRLANQVESSVIYQHIISDLIDAQADLPLAWDDGQKVRASKWAAHAFLARAYLYQEDWVSADLEATYVIEKGPFGSLEDQAYEDIFSAESKESILQFDHVNGYVSGFNVMIPTSASTAPTKPITTALVESFEPGDLRKQAWVGELEVVTAGGSELIYYQKKYKNRTANSASPEKGSGLRLAEQLLIRSESRARQGKMDEAIEDLNQVRRRAGLPDHAVAVDMNEMLSYLEQERKVELFLEWGDRFLNLKRTERLDPVMRAYKETWISRGVTLPIPQKEITYNPNLVQNLEY